MSDDPTYQSLLTMCEHAFDGVSERELDMLIEMLDAGAIAASLMDGSTGEVLLVATDVKSLAKLVACGLSRDMSGLSSFLSLEHVGGDA